MMNFEEQIRERLFSLRDEKYRDFHSSLCPGIPKERIIGVRKPLLRALAKELIKSGEGEKFIKILPHKYMEENDLHGLIIQQIADFAGVCAELDRFLPFVDNWSTCDLISPTAFKPLPKGLCEKAEEWMNSSHTYTCRFGIEMYMKYFLDEGFDLQIPEKICRVNTEEYYIMMMSAWYFATALAKRWDEIIPFIEQKRLDKRTHNKTVQKAVESFRITPRQKEYLRTLRIK